MDSIPERYVVLSFAPGYGGAGGANAATTSIGLVDASQRKRSQGEIAQQMNRMFKDVTNVRVLTVQEQTISVGMMSRGSLPVAIALQHLNFDELKAKVPVFMEEVSKSPVFQGSDVNLKFNKPELQVTIDRLKASELGISILDITNTLQLALSGRRFGYFIRNGKQYEVMDRSTERTGMRRSTSSRSTSGPATDNSSSSTTSSASQRPPTRPPSTISTA
jgi:multidrug efflux pump subunit AcrB